MIIVGQLQKQETGFRRRRNTFSLHVVVQSQMLQDPGELPRTAGIAPLKSKAQPNPSMPKQELMTTHSPRFILTFYSLNTMSAYYSITGAVSDTNAKPSE